MTDPFVEHFHRKMLRSEIDPDVAGMILADYAARITAVREIREPRDLLSSLPRPKPVKHAGEQKIARAAG